MSKAMTTKTKRNVLDMVAINGATHASEALTKWLGRDVHIEVDGFARIPLDRVSNLMRTPEEVIVAIHTQIEGAMAGHVLLAFPEQVAHALIDVLVGQSPGTTTAMDEMGRSALQETGNIVSSAFINSLSAVLAVRAAPGPPEFVHDMAGAIIEPLVLEQAAVRDTVLMIPAVLEIDDLALDWWLLILRSPDSLTVMEALLA